MTAVGYDARPPDIATVAAGVADLAGPCLISAGTLSSAVVSSDAFGGTKHAGIVYRMCAELFVGVAERLRLSADDLHACARAVDAASRAYDQADHRVADGYRSAMVSGTP